MRLLRVLVPEPGEAGQPSSDRIGACDGRQAGPAISVRCFAPHAWIPAGVALGDAIARWHAHRYAAALDGFGKARARYGSSRSRRASTTSTTISVRPSSR